MPKRGNFLIIIILDTPHCNGNSFHHIYRKKHGLVINKKCSFLSPRSWEMFFTRHISPESISKFDSNNCYWIPGEQMHDTIILMKDLQELCVKGTKLSLTQLANILKICQKVIKLDFSYQHHKGLLKALLENPLSNPVVKDVFKKLKCLKISTSVRDAKNYFNDPWVFILKMMRYFTICN